MVRYQRSGPPLVLIGVIVMAVVVVFVIALVIGSSTGTQPTAVDRNSPTVVYSRVVPALERNNMSALYAEMSPAVRDLFPMQSLLEGEQGVSRTQGKITRVQVIEPLAVKTGPEWNGEWAEAKLQVTRGTNNETYLVRFHREDGQWWLLGTLKVE